MTVVSILSVVKRIHLTGQEICEKDFLDSGQTVMHFFLKHVLKLYTPVSPIEFIMVMCNKWLTLISIGFYCKVLTKSHCDAQMGSLCPALKCTHTVEITGLLCEFMPS